MIGSTIKIRIMEEGDFDAVAAIDEKVLNLSRPEYYEAKFEKLFASRNYVPVSLVAENEEGNVVGFVMGELFIGEYGISQEEATLDTIGVDPDCQHKGVGAVLYTSDAADDLTRVDLGGRRIIKKKKK